MDHHNQPDKLRKLHPRIRSIRSLFHKLRQNKAALVGSFFIFVFILLALFGPFLAPYEPNASNVMNKLQPPSADHWFGTDHQGRDIFSRIIHGTSITLYVGFSSVILGATIGILLGLLAGYYGGKTDTIIMRIMDVLLAFPGILLALAIVSVLGGSLTNVIIAVAIFSIPVFARIVRASTMEVKNMEYIDAIKALGARDHVILFKHILPNILSPIIVQATLNIATAILSASGLSFLGMGAQPPTPEWGAMLSDGRNYIFDAPHISIFPGLAIVIVVLAFNLMGDGLRDALDPKMNR